MWIVFSLDHIIYFVLNIEALLSTEILQEFSFFSSLHQRPISNIQKPTQENEKLRKNSRTTWKIHIIKDTKGDENNKTEQQTTTAAAAALKTIFSK